MTPSSPYKGHSPQFSAYVRYGQTAGWIKILRGITWYRDRLRSSNFVLDVDPAHPFPPRQKGGTAFIFWPMSIVAKRLDGSRCHFVRRQASVQVTLLHGDPSPPKKGHNPPLCGPCLLWPNGCPSQLLLSTCLTGQMPFLPHNQQHQSTEGML